MAEETIRLPNSPDVHRSWRRISTGKLSFLYTEEKILPNYLRSPPASCHDVCKYGRKHEFEDKPRVSPLKRVNRSFSGNINLDSPLRKKALTKSVLSPAKSVSLDGSDHWKSEVGNFSAGVCDVKKKNVVWMTGSRLANPSKRKKKTVSKPKPFISIGVSQRRAKEVNEHNKCVIALKLKSVAKTAALALRRSTVNRKKINGGGNAVEPKKAVVRSRAPILPKRCSRSLREKKENSCLSVLLIKSREHVDEKCKELVEEKTLYVMKMNTGNETAESDQNQRCVMDSPTDDPSSEQLKSQDEAEDSVIEVPETEAGDESSVEEKEEYDNVSFSEDQNRTRSKTLSTLYASNGKSMKLRFKRGKIVDCGSQDNTPRKLKFKNGKILTGADLTSTSLNSRRTLKTKGSNISNDKAQQQNPKSLKVVLKHQETQKQKESRALLFNKVIEETANKLVETRKSKVKALVCAFESLISLQ